PQKAFEWQTHWNKQYFQIIKVLAIHRSALYPDQKIPIHLKECHESVGNWSLYLHGHSRLSLANKEYERPGRDAYHVGVLYQYAFKALESSEWKYGTRNALGLALTRMGIIYSVGGGPFTSRYYYEKAVEWTGENIPRPYNECDWAVKGYDYLCPGEQARRRQAQDSSNVQQGSPEALDEAVGRDPTVQQLRDKLRKAQASLSE